ncbi:divergent PAP2 family protein [Caldicellulosiruptoraceae bacterium PP1]
MRGILIDIFSNKALQAGILSWFIAQFIKILIVLVTEKKFDVTRFIGAGGMPSSHSAFVSSLTTVIGIIDGFNSSNFAISLTFALIVMYDAAGVRREAGKQAQTLNYLIESFFSTYIKHDPKLKELIGHKPIEVFAGSILGIVIALLLV